MTHAVAIIGAGPRGLFALERLVAQAAFLPLRHPLAVHVIHDNPFFGAGSNYRPDEADYLLLNFPVSHVRAWPREAPRPAPAVTSSLLEWLRSRYPAQPWTPASHVSRACVGRYLMDAFARVVAAAPAGIEIVCHEAEAVDLRRTKRGFTLALRMLKGKEERRDIRADYVLLTTGHTPEQPSEEQVKDIAFAEKHEQAGYVRHPFPVETWLDDIPPGVAVGLRGAGLTSIDVALALTEGRGGHFTGDAATEPLTYHPSGREPSVIVPFSLTGLPPLPKPAGRWPARDLYRPAVLTRAAVAHLRNEQQGEQLDFRRDIWPLVEREMAHAYYQTLVPLEAHPALRRAACRGDDLAAFATAHSTQDVRPFDAGQLLDPREAEVFSSSEAYHESITMQLRRWTEEARKGRGASAIHAAAEVWNQAFYVIQAVVQFGGLTPASHRDFDEYYKPAFARITYGPPIVNAAKMVALAEAGLLDYGVAARGIVHHHQEQGKYRIESKCIAEATREVNWLIEARMPGAGVSEDATPLFAALRKQGLARDFVNGRGTPDAYSAGGIDLVPQLGTVIGADGQAVAGLSAMGWMTEGALIGNNSLFRETNDYSGAWAAHVLEAIRQGEAKDEGL